MSNLFTTTGRIPRSTYWTFYIFLYGLLIVLGLVGDRLSEGVKVILGLFLLPLMLLGIIVQIKRWHDRDKSGWWVLINFLPCVGALWCLIECGFLPGTPGPNRFGPDPLGRP